MSNVVETIIERLSRLAKQSIAQLLERLKSSIINN